MSKRELEFARVIDMHDEVLSISMGCTNQKQSLDINFHTRVHRLLVHKVKGLKQEMLEKSGCTINSVPEKS